MNRQRKVCPIEDAVREHVRGDDHLHFVTVGARPNALIRALAARYWHDRKSANLVVSGTSLGGTQLGLALLAMGIVRRVITGYVGHQYPTPGPASAAREALGMGTSFELWSLLTLIQRLRAGAMGLDWTTTASLANGSLPSTDPEVRRIAIDGQEVTLVPALRPDIAFVHAVIADEAGNAVLPAPYTEGLVGVLAAKRGALVTAERIVSSAELRRHAHVPTVPATVVLAVSEAPMGAHPSALYAEGIDPSLSYSDDYEFLIELRAALERTGSEREEWIAANVAELAEPNAYATHLGSARIESLRTSWRSAPGLLDDPPDGEATRAERMILTAAGFIAEQVERRPPRFIFAGIGTSSLATWVAQARASEFPPLVSEMGFYDYVPYAGDPWLFATANVTTCSVLNDTETILGSLVQGHAEDGLAVLATGQVDGTGRLNTTLANGRFITGSGGANDAASMIRDVVVVVPHDVTRLVEYVDYPTSPGEHTTAIVTDRAIFVRVNGQFALDAVVASPENGMSLDDGVRAVREATPWPVEVRDSVRLIHPVDPESLRELRRFDPKGYFLAPAKRDRGEASAETVVAGAD